MRKLVKYAILTGTEYPNGISAKDDLESQVRGLIAAGWEPQGGVFVDRAERADGSVYGTYGQAMVKYE